MVDQLAPGQVEALYVLLQGMVPEPPVLEVPAATGHETDLADEPVREISFIGLFAGEPDLAERSKDIVREEKVATLDREHFSAVKPTHCDAFELLPSGVVVEKRPRKAKRAHNAKR